MTDYTYTAVGAIETYQPVLVHSLILDLEKLPMWKDIISALPVGVGVKGGIARKILKVICGLNKSHDDFNTELNGEGDIDILVAVKELTPVTRHALRQEFTGQQFGGMAICAQDIEVNDSMTRYFLTRDVTMNECLVMRCRDDIRLFYTDQAQMDVRQGVISPCVHCLHTGFSQVWKRTEMGQVITPKPLVRCILRWLKGHGISYGISESTWLHYSQAEKLGAVDLFRLLRHFAHDNSKYEVCIRHLITLGLVDASVDMNRLWGEALYQVNNRLASFGHRLTLNPPSVDQVECWIMQKQHEYRIWQMERQSYLARGWTIEPDVQAEVYLPDGLTNFPCFYGAR